MPVRRLVVLGLAIAAAPGLAGTPAAIVFGTPAFLVPPAGEHPIGVAVADVTGDGNADLVLAANDFARLLVHAGDGAGAFGSPSTFLLSATNCTRLRAARLSADATADLVADHFGTTSIDVLIADGVGGFAISTHPASDGAAGETEFLDLADWDGDGDVDIVTASSLGRVRARLNDGTGAFTASQTIAFAAGTTPPAAAFDIAAADLDRDGRTDVALREATATGVYWRQADGSLTAGPRLLPPQAAGFSSHGIAAADFDGDGWLDVVDMRTVLLGGPPPRGALNVFLHTAARAFAPAVPYAVTSGQWDLAAADLNGDLRPEIVVPTDLLLNRGDGTFDPAVALPVAGWGVAVGNFDGDARPDIGVADANTGGAGIPVRGSGLDPFVLAMTPAVLHVGATRQVTLAGSDFASGATADFGPDVAVGAVEVANGSTLVAEVTVSPAATPGPAVATVTNPTGGASSVRFTIAAGGAAGFASVVPERARAGEQVVLTVTGDGFAPPVAIDLGAGVVAGAAEVVDPQTVTVPVAISLSAVPGPRDLTIVNGTGVPTVAPGAFAVTPAPSLDVAVSRGRFVSSPLPQKGAADVRGTLVFNDHSATPEFDPLLEAATAAVGAPDAPLVIAIPAGTGWRVRGDRASWRSAKGALPRAALSLDFAKRTFRLTVSRADPAAPPGVDVRVELALGDDSGASVAPWTPSRRAGELRLP